MRIRRKQLIRMLDQATHRCKLQKGLIRELELKVKILESKNK